MTSEPRNNSATADLQGPAADFTLCDREPITRLERIQSFGFLIAMSRDWRITRVSANLEAMLGVQVQDALGATLDNLVDRDSLHDIRNRMAGLSVAGGVERMYGIQLMAGRAPFDLAVHYVGDQCVLEGEPAGLDSRMDAASLVRKMVARLNTLPSLEAFHRDAARQVRALTGFDRIMIYRFAESGAGEVIAESASPGMESFLGLHYPASDIPAQARALYLLNSFRIIADVRAETIPLMFNDEKFSAPIDLSLAVTRAVSPVHIEYLRNMGVHASASISVIVEGKLWGLIACHHKQAKLPTFVTRTAAELFGQMYSMNLESRLRLSADNQDRHGREAVASVLKAIAGNAALLHDAAWLQDVLRELIQCDGVAVITAGTVYRCGTTPAEAAVESFAKLLSNLSPSDVHVTSNLSALQPQVFEGLEEAAGALSIPISRSPGDYLILFRRELLRDIRWAGEPTKAISLSGDTTRLSPRKSFAVFVESVRDHSRPFSQSEQRLADTIRTGLIDVIWRGRQDTAESSEASGRQELLIAELNHRVRNVLSLIRGLISQTHGEGGDSAAYVESLNGRVQALARAHDRVTRQNWGPGQLNAIFEDEIAAYVPTRRDRFIINGPPVLLHPQAYSTVALIIHELVTNSCKYGALCDHGRVEVTLTLPPTGGLSFRWVERGGPSVREPTRRGFGSVIIERVVPFDLQGTASVRYLEAGLEAEFFVPQRYLVERKISESGNSVGGSARPLQGGGVGVTDTPLLSRNVLLLEDNLIVALEAEDLLRSLGAKTVTAVSSVAGAILLFDSTTYDFAVLDINLGFETSLVFAERLRAAKVPFVFASGYGDRVVAGESRIAELVVSKPYDFESLNSAIGLTLLRHA